MEHKKSNLMQVAVLTVLIIGAVTYASYAWRQSAQGLRGQVQPASGQVADGRGFGPARSLEQRDQEMAELRLKLNLTADQERQLEALRAEAQREWANRQQGERGRGPGAGAGRGEAGGPGGGMGFLRRANDILTPEQQTIAREHFEQRINQWRSQRLAEAQKALSPADFEVYRQKEAERAAEMRDRWSRYGGPGGSREGRGASPTANGTASTGSN